MDTSQLPPLSILYGSATGNAEHIAKQLGERCCGYLTSPSKLSIPLYYSSVTVAPLEEYKKKCKQWDSDLPVSSPLSHHPALIVCSTTGNGDPPENASRFVRFTKRKTTIASKPLGRVAYSVLGLGDTNYDKFCGTAKLIDQKMVECGAVRAMPLSCADEATGLEEAVEPWLDVVVETIGRFVLNIGVDEEEEQGRNEEKKSDEITEKSQEVLKNVANKSLPASTAPATSVSSPPSSLSPGVVLARSLLSDFCDVDQTVEIIPDIPDDLLPTITSVSSAAILINTVEALKRKEQSYADGNHVETNSEASNDASHYHYGRPFHSSVLDARYLTSTSTAGLEDSASAVFEATKHDQGKEGNEVLLPSSTAASAASSLSAVHSHILDDPIRSRRVLEISLSLPTDFSMEVQPGDAIGVSVPNRPEVVNVALSAMSSSTNDAVVLLDPSDSSIDTMSLHKLLEYHLDLTHGSIKHKRVLASLACLATSLDAKVLRLLASKDPAGEFLYQRLVIEQAWDVVDLLANFPSITWDVSSLVAVFPKAVPRYYSVTSSPLVTPDRVTVAASIVDFKTEILTGTQAGGMVRRGLATGRLEVLALPFLMEKEVPASYCGPTIRIFPQATEGEQEFHLPSDASERNLILVGPGTGVAPFVGFLRHLRASRKLADAQNAPAPNGSVDLYFGCRSPTHDWLYRQEMEEFKADGTLTRLRTAFSRTNPDHKEYVQHLIAQDGERIASLLTKGALVYICGDGNHMARDVQSCLTGCLVEHGAMTEEVAIEYITKMKHNGTFLLDIWS